MLKLSVLVVIYCVVFNSCAGFIHSVAKAPIKNVAIIGAGPSGIVMTKRALEYGLNVTVFEQNDVLGGVWWYTDEIGVNKYGINVHSAMYQGLRSNVPVQVLKYPDHLYPDGTASYPTRETVWKYLDSYADRFSVKKFIKYLHLVTKVQLQENEKWKVVVRDLQNNRTEKHIFDAVIVCNGHYFLPRIPVIEGDDVYRGITLHSHDFRRAETFWGQDVLVIGGGPSGRDLVALLSKTANRVTWSQRKTPEVDEDELPPKVSFKDEVKRFTEFGAEFTDGEQKTFTVVIYATGYNYSFPFLGNDSGITLNDNFIQPLYKHVFNIEHPTMAFMGIATGPVLPTLDLQALFIAKHLSGVKELPSKDEMLEDMQTQMFLHWRRDGSIRHSHSLGEDHPEYFDQLSNLTETERPKEVLTAIYVDNDVTRKRKPVSFRKYRYTIVDDVSFKKAKYEI